MRVLFVVQRYGLEVAGGAELACRQFATHLAGRGHEVHALTSRATSYVDWADQYPPASEQLDGVTVHRLGVQGPRQHRYFDPLNARAIWSHRPSSPVLQEAWMQAQGPDLRPMAAWLEGNAANFDVAVFFTYLYWTTWKGLSVLAPVVPTLLHPTAHDEPPLWLSIFDRTLRLPTRHAWFTPEERELLTRRAGRALAGEVVGIGIDPAPPADPARFRAAYGLGERPYLLYLGRVDPAKGSVELYEQFVAYQQRHPGSDLSLVIIGDRVSSVPAHPNVVSTGFVDEQTKADAIAGCLALAQPSYFESFSLALTEAWAHGRPALVQGHCDVLDGQARRSGGAIPYLDFAEWEATVELLLDRPDVVAALGSAGRRYVTDTYSWDVVLDRYEALLDDAVAAGPRSPSPQRR